MSCTSTSTNTSVSTLTSAERKKRKFIIGDIVKVKSWDEMAAKYGLDEDGDINTRCCFTKSMHYYCGKEFKIIDRDEHCITLEHASNWSFTPDMLTLVKSAATVAPVAPIPTPKDTVIKWTVATGKNPFDKSTYIFALRRDGCILARHSNDLGWVFSMAPNPYDIVAYALAPAGTER